LLSTQHAAIEAQQCMVKHGCCGMLHATHQPAAQRAPCNHTHTTYHIALSLCFTLQPSGPVPPARCQLRPAPTRQPTPCHA
jgi:hypothetical protein